MEKEGYFFNEVNFDRFSSPLKTIIFREACFFLKRKKSRSLCKFLYGLTMKYWESCRFAILNLGGNIFLTSFSLQNEAVERPFFSSSIFLPNLSWELWKPKSHLDIWIQPKNCFHLKKTFFISKKAFYEG